MAAALLRYRKSGWISRVKALVNLSTSRTTTKQKFNHTLTEAPAEAEMTECLAQQVKIEMSKWKKVDARKFGITRSRIPQATWIILKVLRGEGVEAYLVGGCVRDLILNRVPKDFDVITTAKLKQIRKLFHRCQIVGRRFPICTVHVKGTAIEVSSFETVARHTEETDGILSQIPSGCDEIEFARWRNSMRRDFTVNSLFLDPFSLKIYDYVEGIADLRSLKLRTLIPAHLSFKEDRARIMRGLRIAARLGLSLSKDTESAICDLSSSIRDLNKDRILMELNYMLSYGAAEASLNLLRRFNLLEILLPFHAAYLDHHTSNHAGQSTVMLMRLFSHLDKLLTCDQPSDCVLWVGLLAFHLALVNSPQSSQTLCAFASTLYHGRWKEGVKMVKKEPTMLVGFSPEISGSSESQSDEELAKEVSSLATLVQDSVQALTNKDSLAESMSKYPLFPSSGLVFVSKRVAHDVSRLFEVLVNDIESYEDERESYEIDYYLLGKGDVCETRFVLGKIILETLSSEAPSTGREVLKNNGSQKFEDKQKQECYGDASSVYISDAIKQKKFGNREERQGLSILVAEEKEKGAKRRKLTKQKSDLSERKHNSVEKKSSSKKVEEHSEMLNETHDESMERETRKQVKEIDKHIAGELIVEEKALQKINGKLSVKKKSRNCGQDAAEKKGKQSLYSLFK